MTPAELRDVRAVLALAAGVLALAALAAALGACCSTHYRDDGTVGGRRYYRVDVCTWGERVVCDSPRRLPDPVTQAGGCR